MKPFQRVYVEITNQCNLQCSFCPGTGRKKGFVSKQVFEKRIAEIAPLAEQVFLHVLGEPLLHPELPDLLQICRQYELPVNVCTNGFLLDASRENMLFDPIVRQVNFSLQALLESAVPHTAEKVFQKILQFCRNAPEQRPDLYINLRTWDFSRDFAHSALKDKLIQQLTEAFDLTGRIPDFSRGRKSHRLCGRIYWNADTRFEWPVSGKEQSPQRQPESHAVPMPELDDPLMQQQIRNAPAGFCHGLGSQFAVLTGGEVVPCCLDSEGSAVLGNMDEKALSDILSSPVAAAIREGFKQHRVWHSFCRTCSFRKRFDQNKYTDR